MKVNFKREDVPQFNEGDDYFSLEANADGEYIIALSCWDDQSEEIKNPYVFKTVREALNFCHDNGVKEVTYYDYTMPYGVKLKV